MRGPRVGALTPRCHLRPDVCALDSGIHVSVVPPFVVQDGYHNSKSHVLTGQCPKTGQCPNKKDEGNGEKGGLFPALSAFIKEEHLG